MDEEHETVEEGTGEVIGRIERVKRDEPLDGEEDRRLGGVDERESLISGECLQAV